MTKHRILCAAFYGMLLLSAGILSSCSETKNYDEDVKSLNDRLAAIEASINEFKKQLTDAINEKLYITDYYMKDGGWVLSLSDGQDITIPAPAIEEKAPLFFQFKVADGKWQVSKDGGANWTMARDTQGNEIAADETDNVKFDATVGMLYIGTHQTDITCSKENPVLAENQLNNTLYISIGGESYIIPMNESHYSGISSILFRKQHVFDKDDYLEASILEDENGTILVSTLATASFKILPADIDLTGAEYACTDIHRITTRAEAPQLNIEKTSFANGILTTTLRPSDMEDGMTYGAVLEITMNEATTSSDYFTVRPIIRKVSQAGIFQTTTHVLQPADEVIEFNNTGTYDLAAKLSIGFASGENGEYVAMPELGFSNEVMPIAAKYELVGAAAGYSLTAEGKLSANASETGGAPAQVKITYSFAGKEVSGTYKFMGVTPLAEKELTGELTSLYPNSKAPREVELTAVGATLANAEAAYALGIKDAATGVYAKVEGVSLKMENNIVKLVIDQQWRKDETTPSPIAGINLYAIDANNRLANIGGECWTVKNVTIHNYTVKVTPKTEGENMKDGVIFGRRGEDTSKGNNYYTFENISMRDLYDIVPEDLDVTFTPDASKRNDGNDNNEKARFSWNEVTQTFTINKRVTARLWQVVVTATYGDNQTDEKAWIFQSPINVDNVNTFLPMNPNTPIIYDGSVSGTISFTDLVKKAWTERLSIKNLIDETEWLVYKPEEGLSETAWAKANLRENSASIGLFFRIGQINGQNFATETSPFCSRSGEKWINHDFDSTTGIFECTDRYDPTQEYILKMGVGYYSDFGTTYFSNNQIVVTIPAQK